MKFSQDVFQQLVRNGFFDSRHPNEVELLDVSMILAQNGYLPGDKIDERFLQIHDQIAAENQRRKIHNDHWRSVQKEENLRQFVSTPGEAIFHDDPLVGRVVTLKFS